MTMKIFFLFLALMLSGISLLIFFFFFFFLVWEKVEGALA